MTVTAHSSVGILPLTLTLTPTLALPLPLTLTLTLTLTHLQADDWHARRQHIDVDEGAPG